MKDLMETDKSETSFKVVSKEHYFRETYLKKKNINGLIVLLIILFCIIEVFYRNPLYEYSFVAEKKIQESLSNTSLQIFKIITNIGGKYFIAVVVVFVFYYFSIIKSSIFILGLMACLQINYIIKTWYGNLRPFMEDKTLFQGECEGGYGNPSSHSMINTFLYLTLFVYLKNTKLFKKGRKIVEPIVLFLFIIWIIVICSSRFILGVHSINQVIYGMSLGLSIFLLIIVVFKLHQMPVSFYKKFFKKSGYIIAILSIIIILIGITFLNKFIVSKNIDIDIDKYNTIIDKICGDNFPQYKRFNNESLYGSFTIFCILGLYLGQLIFWCLIDYKYKKQSINTIIKDESETHTDNDKKNEIELDFMENSEEENNRKNIQNNENDDKLSPENKSNNYINGEKIDEYINNWNDNRYLYSSGLNSLFSLIIILLISIPFLIIYLIIPKNTNLLYLFIFKVGIPFFGSVFAFYSLGFYFVISLMCGPQEFILTKLNQKESKKIKLFD